MITPDRITEKARSDRVSSSLVFKEHVQLAVLDYLFRKGLFSQMVFQGGTALRLVYQGVRYSEDLDFVLRKKDLPCFLNMREELQPLTAHLKKFLPFVRQARLKAQKETASFRRYCVILESDFLSAQDQTNIELANVPSRKHQTVILRHPDTMTAPAVTVETPEEILSDKCVAFAARDYIKGRDLWDIYFLLSTLKIALNRGIITMVKKKISDYGLTENAFLASFEQKTKLLESKGASLLREEMDKFLPASYRESFQSQYVNICKNHALVFRKLLEDLKQ